MFSIIVAVLFVIKIYSNSVHSLPKDNVSLILALPVLYLVIYNLYYEPWSRKCIKLFGSNVINSF